MCLRRVAILCNCNNRGLTFVYRSTPTEYWGTVSSDAKRLISSLLTVDPRKRLTARGAMENGWIMGDDAKLARNDLGANLYKLRNFNAKRKLRAAVSAIIAMNRLNTLAAAFSGGN